MASGASTKNRPIFISCADIEVARYIRDALEQLPAFWGFIARDEPRTFEYPSEKIAQMLERCSAYIILYTRSGFDSPMVNQEFGFFYHRYRNERIKPPIMLIKSQSISGEIDGFAYGREPIPFDSTNPKKGIDHCLEIWFKLRVGVPCLWRKNSDRSIHFHAGFFSIEDLDPFSLFIFNLPDVSELC